MRKKALVLGATGLIGQSLTNQLIANDLYENILLFVRKPSGFTHPKIVERIVDFNNLEGIKLGVDQVFCCLGTTIKTAGSKEAFRNVDFALALHFANLAQKEKVELYAIVTAMGANADSKIFYNRVKGEIEEAIAALNMKSFGIFRPSMLLGDRKEARLGEKIGKLVMRAIDFITPDKYKAIHVDQVSKAMVTYATQPKPGVTIIENDAMLA